MKKIIMTFVFVVIFLNRVNAMEERNHSGAVTLNCMQSLIFYPGLDEGNPIDSFYSAKIVAKIFDRNSSANKASSNEECLGERVWKRLQFIQAGEQPFFNVWVKRPNTGYDKQAEIGERCAPLLCCAFSKYLELVKQRFKIAEGSDLENLLFKIIKVNGFIKLEPSYAWPIIERLSDKLLEEMNAIAAPEDCGYDELQTFLRSKDSILSEIYQIVKNAYETLFA